MARKIVDISSNVDSYALLSQTPGNYDKNNYYLKELQDKFDADWEHRFNRVDVEYENSWGNNVYLPIEVVQQHIKTDKGTDYTDDYRRLVFRDIREKRFNIGNKFRFMADNSQVNYVANNNEYDRNDPRDIWIVTNFSSIKATTSVIVTKCNSLLGSMYNDEHGVSHLHYEPFIVPTDLTATNLFYNQVAISPQSGFVGIVQHNNFTKEYKLNQRFIIGYDMVYRIKAIDKFYGKNTNNPNSVGLMKIYFEVTESSVDDNFETLIASQLKPVIEVIHNDNSNYNIKITKPDVMVKNLTYNPITFEAFLYNGDTLVQKEIDVDLSLDYLPETLSINKYVTYEKITNNSFSLKKVKIYGNGQLTVKVYVSAENSPTGEEISISFKLNVNGIS